MLYLLALVAIAALAVGCVVGMKLNRWTAAYCPECGEALPLLHAECFARRHRHRAVLEAVADRSAAPVNFGGWQ